MALLPFFLFSQVKLVSSDATKVYPDDTRITYMELSDYPSDAEFLQFVEKEVLQNRMIQRFSLYPNGTTCFFHSQKDITEDMIVEEINDAYYLYYTTEAYKPSKEIDNKTVSKGDSEKENVRQVNNKTVSKETIEKSRVKRSYNEVVSKGENEKSDLRQDQKDVVDEKIPSSEKSEFAKVEEKSDTRIVYFTVSGLDDVLQLKDFQETLVQDKNIYSVEMNDDYLFKLNINYLVTPSYIQNILDDYNAKIDGEYLNKF